MRVFVGLSVIVAMAVFIILLRYNKSLTLKDAQAGSWVTGDCSEGAVLSRYCVGADIEFNEEDCLLKDDGYMYHYQEQIGEFTGGFIPLISESAPRRGAVLRMRDLHTGEICTWDSTSKVSILGL